VLVPLGPQPAKQAFRKAAVETRKRKGYKQLENFDVHYRYCNACAPRLVCFRPTRVRTSERCSKRQPVVAHKQAEASQLLGGTRQSYSRWMASLP
jgi:hypothetical protein